MEIKEYKHQWYLKNRERLIKEAKEYHKNNPQYKKWFNEYMRNYKRKNRIKVNARNRASARFKNLKKEGFEFHHPDYNKPLEIVILPKEEHRKLHINERRCSYEHS